MPIENFPHLLLVDDHEMVAAGMAQLLSTHFRVTVACNFAQMQTRLNESEFAIVLLDLQMSDGIPSKRYREVVKQYKLPILIVASEISDAELFQCYKDGVSGYVPKKLSAQALVGVIANVLRNVDYWEPNIRERLKDFIANKPEVPKRFLPVIRQLLAPTPMSDQEIAEAENLSMRTINNYIHAMLTLYNVTDRHQLISKLTQMGYKQDFLPE